jgi:hypothetical protein
MIGSAPVATVLQQSRRTVLLSPPGAPGRVGANQGWRRKPTGDRVSPNPPPFHRGCGL